MRIDGPRNLESTAQLSGSFSGSFRGKFTNKVADASVSGSFSGSFSGIGTGSFSGSFYGNGAGLGNVFKRIIVSPNNVVNTLDANYSGLIIFASESGAGLRIKQGPVSQDPPEVNFELVNIPNSSLANSTISGIELGENLNNLQLDALNGGLGFSGGATSYNGQTARTLQLNLSNLTPYNGLTKDDFFIIEPASDAGAIKKMSAGDWTNYLAGDSLTTGSTGQLQLDTTINVQTVRNSTSLTLARDANNSIVIEDGAMTFKVGGADLMTFTPGTVNISEVNIDATAGSNITDFNIISSVSGSMPHLQGNWYGVPTAQNTPTTDVRPGSSIRIKGIPQCFVGERNGGSMSPLTSGNNTFAYGNGASTDGVPMPFGGYVLAVSIGWSSTFGTSGIDTVRWELSKNGVSAGNTEEKGAIVITSTGDTLDAASSKSNTDISDETAARFEAGDVITWMCTQHSAGGVNQSPLAPAVTLAFWVIFD